MAPHYTAVLFLLSPPQAETFDDYDTVHTCEDLADGILLHKIMQTV
jgi:hypothetical protein